MAHKPATRLTPTQLKRRLVARLKQQIKDLTAESEDLIRQMDRWTSEEHAHLKSWHSSNLHVSLIASGEPGQLQVTCSLKTPTKTFSQTKDFQVINVCQSLQYVAPTTMKVWRDNLTIACDVLDRAMEKSGE